MLRFILVLVFLTGCGRATRNARAIDPRAECVSRKDDLALCKMSDGRIFVCDDDRCIRVDTPAAACLPVLEASDNGAKGGDH